MTCTACQREIGTEERDALSCVPADLVAGRCTACCIAPTALPPTWRRRLTREMHRAGRRQSARRAERN